MTRNRPPPSEDEFQPGFEQPPEVALDRRELMRLLGASAALSGLGVACDPPREKIVPYVRRPSQIVPGRPLFYATSYVLDGFATGLVAQSREGRPIKVDGNPEHPASLGATSAIEQASVLDLYDPERLAGPEHEGKPSSWDQALSTLAGATRRGRPPWFVAYPQSSPTLGELATRVVEQHPGARFCFTSPVSAAVRYDAARILFGHPLQTQYRFGEARTILALDADFASGMPMSARYAHDFASRRRTAQPSSEMNRLYAVDAMITPTSSLADHRLAVRAADVAAVAARVLAQVLAILPEAAKLSQELQAALPPSEGGPHAEFVAALARDLVNSAGAALVVAGDQQPLETHVLAHALNFALGSVGRTVWFSEPVLLQPEGGASLFELAEALRTGAVETLIVLGPDLVQSAPAELGLERWLRTVKNSAHLTGCANATSRACRWTLPETHYLEQWGDARAYDGTLSFVQPLIAPLRPARSAIEVLAAFTSERNASAASLLRRHWERRLGADFGVHWESLIQRGFVPESQFRDVEVRPNWTACADVVRRVVQAGFGGALELRFEVSPSLYDGRFARNPWLQELPHPTTKHTWDAVAVVSPRRAASLGIDDGDVLELSARGRSLKVPAILSLGHADDSISLTLGYGTADGAGNPFTLVPADGRLFSTEVRVRPTGARESLAVTQGHQSDEDRPIAPTASLAAYRRNPDFTASIRDPLPSMLPVYPYTGTQWGMTIDTSLCTGCSSCVVACQAENNIPVVGKRDVMRSREMHWLRIDRYWVRGSGGRRVVNQPMLCQHCENAPCEYVCPVNATVHSPDGLNEMVYNRCIGTRFCSNNCPYKVRRFNWFDYTERDGTQRMQRNPEVTVRSRGVMEKCTFCVQRIRHAEASSRSERRAIAPGEVVTACQQACPTGAIQFGALEHRETRMVRWRREPRRYAVLHELNTRPRVIYLASIYNPNPELEA